MIQMRQWKIYVGSFACLMILFWLVATSESFQDCEHTRKNTQPYKALHEEVGFSVKLISKIKMHVACTRKTAAENDGAITALSGIAVAAFTLLLWITTNTNAH